MGQFPVFSQGSDRATQAGWISGKPDDSERKYDFDFK
jgi:hypothetical protein